MHFKIFQKKHKIVWYAHEYFHIFKDLVKKKMSLPPFSKPLPFCPAIHQIVTLWLFPLLFLTISCHPRLTTYAFPSSSCHLINLFMTHSSLQSCHMTVYVYTFMCFLSCHLITAFLIRYKKIKYSSFFQSGELHCWHILNVKSYAWLFSIPYICHGFYFKHERRFSEF